VANRTLFNLRRFAARFRCLRPAGIAGDLTRAARLHLADPPRRPPGPTVDHRVVITLTAIPERIRWLRPVLRSLVDQSHPADRVVLAWPWRSLRTGLPYPAPPPVPAGIEVIRCGDDGPVTKLLPVLAEEPDALIVVVDDDVIYPVDFVRCLLAGHARHTDAVVGLRGWRFQGDVDWARHLFGTGVNQSVEVDILLGTWGYLVPPGAFDRAVHDFTGWPPEVRWVDDIWVCGHLARRGVKRVVVPATGLPVETVGSWIAALSAGPNRSGGNDRIGLATFARWWRVPPL